MNTQVSSRGTSGLRSVFKNGRAQFEQLETRQMLTSVQLVDDFNSATILNPEFDNLVEFQGDAYFSSQGTADLWKLAGDDGEPQVVLELSQFGGIDFMSTINDRIVVGISDAGLGAVQLIAFDPISAQSETLFHAQDQARFTAPTFSDELIGVRFDDVFTTSYLFTDGTSEGTYSVGNRDSVDQFSADFAKSASGLYFAALGENDSLSISFIGEGQQQAASIDAMAVASRHADQASLGLWAEQLLFSVESENGRELWVADSTDLSARQLADLNPGPESSDPSGFASVQESVYFIANDGTHRQLWELDAAGITQKLSESTGDVQSFHVVTDEERGLDALYVSETGNVYSIGQAGGATDLLVSESQISLVGSEESVFAIVGNANESSSLYAWDGTSFEMLTTQPTTFELVGSSNSGTHFRTQSQIWYTEGTADSTVSLGAVGRNFTKSVGLSESVVFLVNGEVRQANTEVTTRVGPSSQTQSSFVHTANRVGDSVVFYVANEPLNTDFTFTGPLLVLQNDNRLAPLWPDHFWDPFFTSPESKFYPIEGTEGEGYYFARQASQTRFEIWRTDFTQAGSSRLAESEVSELLPGLDLRQVSNLPELESEMTRILGPSADQAMNTARPSTIFNGRRVTTGVINGDTFLISDNDLIRVVSDEEFEIVANVPPADRNFGRQLVALNDSLLFVADDGVHGSELWQFDGSEISLVRDVRPGEIGSSPQLVGVTASSIFYSSDDGVHGAELWQYDGQELFLAQDIRPGRIGSSPNGLVATDDTVFFQADDGVHGREIWSAADAVDSILGDIDGDLEVTFEDFLILSQNFGQAGGPAEGDLDGDGMISFADFLLLASNFGSSLEP